jgi:hypothetical protein
MQIEQGVVLDTPTPQIQVTGCGHTQQAHQCQQPQIEYAKACLCGIALANRFQDGTTQSKPNRNTGGTRLGQTQHAHPDGDAAVQTPSGQR